MLKKLFFWWLVIDVWCLILGFAFSFPAYAQNRAGINIGTKYSDIDQAITIVGKGGWIVVIAGGTGDCLNLQPIIDKASSAGINLIIRGHLNNYLTPPDALGWAATLGQLNTNGQKIYFMPWNEPNQAGSKDWGDPKDVAAYTSALQQNFSHSGVKGKIALLSPMLNQTWIGGQGDFNNYVNQLKSFNNNYFNQFDGISLNLYDFSQQICGKALCAADPHFNPAKFNDILNIMGASGKPVFGVEAGTAGKNFYWKTPPVKNSPLYQFAQKFLSQSQPQMFALPSYDLGGEVGHSWSLFNPPDVTNLLKTEPNGNTNSANFNENAFNAWLKTYVDSGSLVPCGQCGWAPKENPGLCTASGSPNMTEQTSFTPCINIDEKDNFGSEQSTPILINEEVTYSSDEEGSQPKGEEKRCFDVGWKANLDLAENTFQMPWAYYLNQYFIGFFDIHRYPPETIKPLEWLEKNKPELTGPLVKLTSRLVQDKLKNQFLKKTVEKINQSRQTGKAQTMYISKDLSQVYTIGPWTLEQIYQTHNVYKIRQKNPQAKIDKMTLAVWQLVPFFGNEMTEGNISFSSVDMNFDPNPVITKNPEVYRLNKISKFLKDLLVPKPVKKTTAIIGKGVYGDTGGTWQKQENNICYDASDPQVKEGDKKESSYFLGQSLSSYDYEVKTTLNFGALKTHMGVWLRTLVDRQFQQEYQGKWPNFAGIKGYNFSFIPKKNSLIISLWKTTPPDYLLNDPQLLKREVISLKQEQLNFIIKTRVQGSLLQAFVDLNNNGLIEDAQEKVLEFNDSDFSAGGIGFSIYNPKNSRSCFTNYQFNSLQQSLLKPSLKQNKSLAFVLAGKIKKIKPKIFATFKNLLASTKLFQPKTSLISQAEPNCSNPFSVGIENVSYDGSQLFYGVRFTNNPPWDTGGQQCHLIINGHFGGQCIYPGGSYYQAGASSGVVNPVPAPGDGTYIISASGYLDRHKPCGVTPVISTSCQVVIAGGKITATNCNAGLMPTGPKECKTPESQAFYPDPKALYDLQNYTPGMCLDPNRVKITGKRFVKNECPYKLNPLTGQMEPQICVKNIVSAINVLNTVPWLDSIAKQTISINSGLFRIFNPANLYQEGKENNPFNPIPAKDQVAYNYTQTAADPQINTSLADSGPWDLLFANLGGVVKAQQWLVEKVLNPLTSQTIKTSPYQPIPIAPPEIPSPQPNPSNSPQPNPVKPPAPTKLPAPNIPGIIDGSCAQPQVIQVNDPDNRNYVFGNYAGPLQRNNNNAHSDKPFLATIVEWPDKDFRFVFSQETGANSPFFEFKDKSGVRFQFYEGAQGSGELYNRYGRLTQNSKVKIYQQSPLIIQWEYWDVNKDTGKKVNHAVEYYTFYPCGLVLREMKFLEKLAENGYSFEPIEVILMNPVNKRWFDNIKKENGWYHPLSIFDAYSDKKRDHFARPIDGELNKSETKEKGVSLAEIENMAGKIFNFHLKSNEVFMIYGDSSGLPNETILDVAKSWGHPCFDHGLIGWINSEWHKCTPATFNVYPNATPIIGINHQPENDKNGQHNFTLLGVLGKGIGNNAKDLQNLAKNWLENQKLH